MPVELYESMFAIDSGRMATDADSIKDSIVNLIEKLGGEVLVSRPWNENQKLAYPINKQKKAYYQIMYYKMESKRQMEMEAEIRLTMTDFMLRHLTSNVDPRYAEVMLNIAREEQSPGFALRMMHDEPSPTDMTPATINDPGAPPLGAEFGPVPNLNPDAGPPPSRRPAPRRDAEKPE